jgi:hypothetical protein
MVCAVSVWRLHSPVAGGEARTTLGVFGSIATGYLNLPKTDWKRSLTPQFEKNEAAN